MIITITLQILSIELKPGTIFKVAMKQIVTDLFFHNKVDIRVKQIIKKKKKKSRVGTRFNSSVVLSLLHLPSVSIAKTKSSFIIMYSNQGR